ncbi:hypothetical protein SAMN05216343_11140 [Oscillibacter sp. PC13]|jgi:hypothetical protein|nr:hypothetical protein SAMN05216343_11140 [Oscillibacter sp. PC13]
MARLLCRKMGTQIRDARYLSSPVTPAGIRLRHPNFLYKRLIYLTEVETPPTPVKYRGKRRNGNDLNA